MPTADRKAVVSVTIAASTFELSATLRSLLADPADRLFVVFAVPSGTLVGASHGKVCGSFFAAVSVYCCVGVSRVAQHPTDHVPP